ncbi:FAD-dependent monooxygenase [Archangium sp.]|uniref:FAD-dependent monooxygenase n=1 Tax=Archangium sp. TaxID=1872627 RepID=UPI002D732CD4|nr:FAD-dependent monooxygenase [Archangium sp.]HYO51213.1 FAD-dependent monooxygenase [Archangium sp.]
MSRRILIVGGGIGGLTAALALRRAGFEPVVFEQAHALQPVGAGIQLSPNATRALIQLGYGAGLRAIASSPQALEARSWRSGRRIFSTPLGERCLEAYGAPYYHVHRADLHALLSQALGPEGLRLSARCTGFAEEGDGVRVEFEDGSSEWGDLLIGADGIRSITRTVAFGPEQPRFSGNVAFRAVIPARSVEGLPLERNTTAWWGPGKHFVHYFISGGSQLNCIAVVPSRTWSVESWSTEGTREELLAEFEGWHPLVQAVIRATGRVFKWALYDRDPLPRWSLGRVTLLGDAAHPMLPFQAQGAAQAIEDAMVLASCLSRHAEQPRVALEAYERIRKPRTSRIQEISRHNAQLFHLARQPRVLLRDTQLRFLNRHRSEKLARRMDWLFAHDPLAVAEPSTGLGA